MAPIPHSHARQPATLQFFRMASFCATGTLRYIRSRTSLRNEGSGRASAALFFFNPGGPERVEVLGLWSDEVNGIAPQVDFPGCDVQSGAKRAVLDFPPARTRLAGR